MSWQKKRAVLTKARREWLHEKVRHSDPDPTDFRRVAVSRVELVAALREAIEDEQDAVADALDPSGWTEDDDSGYGPHSYFAHGMSKDD